MTKPAKMLPNRRHTKRQWTDADFHNVERRHNGHRLTKFFQTAAQSVITELRAVDQHRAHQRQTGCDVQILGRRCYAKQAGHIGQSQIQADRTQIRCERAPVGITERIVAKLLIKPTSISAAICRRPGFLRIPCVSQIATSVSTSMIAHVTTADSGTGIPPNSGISNAVCVCSCALSSALIASNRYPPFLFLSFVTYYSDRNVKSFPYESKKNKMRKMPVSVVCVGFNLMRFANYVMIGKNDRKR